MVSPQLTSIGVTDVRGINPKRALNAMSVIAAACVGLLGASVMHCTNKARPIVICDVLEPIEWAGDDTEQTKEQIVVYNKVWDRYCK